MLLVEIKRSSERLYLFGEEKKFDFGDNMFIGLGVELYYIPDNLILDEDIDDKKELIGRIEGTFFDFVYAINEGYNLALMLDAVSAETYSLALHILDKDYCLKDEYFTFNTNLYYIEDIFIQEKYRGQGYAKLLLSNLADILMYTAKVSVGLIATSSDVGNEVDEKRLVKLYENTGFKQIDNSDYFIIFNE